jgi:ATP-dependent DNA helicase RecQ
MSSPGHADILAAIKRHWGFDTLRPIQAEAIHAGISRRDSLVVMPTGGGKSLCYQVPPLVTRKVGVVVSPLIALMKDQVDALRLVGYPAAALHSHLAPGEAGQIERDLLSGDLKLLLLSPERLLTERSLSILQRAGIDSFAIDEAHCISQWGHDFRPEYRRLAELRQIFPGASLHAYTATATPRVRGDIVEQLQLHDPTLLVGTFDRPNLAYRVVPRVRLVPQVLDVLSRHENEASIIYTISRKDAESLALSLQAEGIDAKAYHAGMDAGARTRIQDDFRFERLRVVVATVAFGMGIDRSDVRTVIHAAMPKSVEAYQQETGRAGRDGLPAECVMLYSAGDVMRWKRVIEFGAEEQQAAPEYTAAQIQLMNEMQRVCTGVRCRHRALSEYFGQEYTRPVHTDTSVVGCGACDVCLGEMDEVPDATTIARKILSCVARVNQGFGARHVLSVLRGKATPKVLEKGHDKLSTFGLLQEYAEPDLMGYVDQLIDQGVLARSPGEYPVLTFTPQSAPVLKGETPVVLREAKKIEREAAGPKGRAGDGPPLSDAERALFESLRALRRKIADELAVPAFVVFADSTLQEMCRVRPSSKAALINVRGVGQRKVEQFGERILEHLRAQCGMLGLNMDNTTGSRPRSAAPGETTGRSAGSLQAAEFFEKEMSIADVAARMGRARSTVSGYLADYIQSANPASIAAWVDDAVYARIEAALQHLGDTQFKYVFGYLKAQPEGEVGYDEIRWVREHLSAEGRLPPPNVTPQVNVPTPSESTATSGPGLRPGEG